MIVLYVLLWTLAAIIALALLVLLLLCISAGVRITNKTKNNEMKIVARYGIMRLKISPRKTLSAEKAAKKAEKKAAKKEKKALQKARKASKKHSKTPSKQAEKSPVKNPLSLFINIRSFIASFFDYDAEYLKLIYVKKLYVFYAVGGAGCADIGRRFSRVCEVGGILFPIAKNVLKIKKHRIIILPDFVTRKTVFRFDAVILVRPIKVLAAAYKLWRANERNRKIYGDNPQEIKHETVKGRVMR